MVLFGNDYKEYVFLPFLIVFLFCHPSSADDPCFFRKNHSECLPAIYLLKAEVSVKEGTELVEGVIITGAQSHAEEESLKYTFLKLLADTGDINDSLENSQRSSRLDNGFSVFLLNYDAELVFSTELGFSDKGVAFLLNFYDRLCANAICLSLTNYLTELAVRFDNQDVTNAFLSGQLYRHTDGEIADTFYDERMYNLLTKTPFYIKRKDAKTLAENFCTHTRRPLSDYHIFSSKQNIPGFYDHILDCYEYYDK